MKLRIIGRQIIEANAVRLKRIKSTLIELGPVKSNILTLVLIKPGMKR